MCIDDLNNKLEAIKTNYLSNFEDNSINYSGNSSHEEIAELFDEVLKSLKSEMDCLYNNTENIDDKSLISSCYATTRDEIIRIFSEKYNVSIPEGTEDIILFHIARNYTDLD